MKLWPIAWFAWLVASTALFFAVGGVEFHDAATMQERAVEPTIGDEGTHPPEGWEKLPVVARVDPEKITETYEEGAFGGRTKHSRAPLGPFVVTWDEDVCTWGGSACGPYIPKWQNLRVGDPDRYGRPMMSTSISCNGTTPWDPVSSTPKNRSCSMRTMVLRQVLNTTVNIVSFRDPDDEERLVSAFERTAAASVAARKAAPPSKTFLLFPALGVLVGLAALVTARRYRRIAASRDEVPTTGAVYRDAAPVERKDADPVRAGARSRAALFSGAAVLAFAASTAASVTMIASSR